MDQKDVTSMFSGDAGSTASVVLPDPFFVNEGEGANWGPGSRIVALYYGPRTCRHFMQLAEVDGEGRTTFREIDGSMMRRAAQVVGAELPEGFREVSQIVD